MNTMTTGQAAKRLRVTPATIRNWIDAGHLEAEQDQLPTGRRRIRVVTESVEKLEQRLRWPEPGAESRT